MNINFWYLSLQKTNNVGKLMFTVTLACIGSIGDVRIALVAMGALARVPTTVKRKQWQ